MENTLENLNYVMNMKNKQELIDTIIHHSIRIAKEEFLIKDEQVNDVVNTFHKNFKRHCRESIKILLFREVELTKDIKYLLTRDKFIEKIDDIYCHPCEDDDDDYDDK